MNGPPAGPVRASKNAAIQNDIVAGGVLKTVTTLTRFLGESKKPVELTYPGNSCKSRTWKDRSAKEQSRRSVARTETAGRSPAGFGSLPEIITGIAPTF